jgi:RNA polymerase-binding transcription factor DksA
MTRAHLSAADLDGFRTQLAGLVDRLTGDVSALRGEAEGQTDQSGQGDAATRDADDLLSQSLLGQEEESLAECRAALQRLDAGTFGRCEECGQPIAVARLRALPHARTCIACAQAAERR